MLTQHNAKLLVCHQTLEVGAGHETKVRTSTNLTPSIIPPSLYKHLDSAKLKLGLCVYVALGTTSIIMFLVR